MVLHFLFREWRTAGVRMIWFPHFTCLVRFYYWIMMCEVRAWFARWCEVHCYLLREPNVPPPVLFFQSEWPHLHPDTFVFVLLTAVVDIPHWIYWVIFKSHFPVCKSGIDVGLYFSAGCLPHLLLLDQSCLIWECSCKGEYYFGASENGCL